jgi:hypothetical protein
MSTKYRALAAIFAVALIPLDAVSLTCPDLDGAYVVSEESPQVYLGFFGAPTAADSIENPAGQYGSTTMINSVRNPAGPYGSLSGSYSANNPNTIRPPIIAKFQVGITFLTTNADLQGLSLATIDSICGTTSFVSTQPALDALPPPTTKIGPGFSGNWDDPTPGQDGHGFQFEILPNNGMLAIWFVFTPDGSGPTWLYAQGSYDPTSNTVTLPTYLSTGPKFPPNYNVSDRHLTQWGTLTFTFTDCSHGTASWTSTAQGYPATGSFPIARVTSIAGTTCP